MKILLLVLIFASFQVNATTATTDFWAWFQKTESNFPETTQFDEKYGNELSARLAQVKPGLTYEIATPLEGEKELIISADGISELIPYVEQLVKSAPRISDWTFTAFRQRMPDDWHRVVLDYGGHEFNPQEMWCYSRVQDGYFDLVLYHPGYSDSLRNHIVGGSFILLDMAIGEYDVMTGIRYIDHRKLPRNQKKEGLYRFQEIRNEFDKFKSGLK